MGLLSFLSPSKIRFIIPRSSFEINKLLAIISIIFFEFSVIFFKISGFSFICSNMLMMVLGLKERRSKTSESLILLISLLNEESISSFGEVSNIDIFCKFGKSNIINNMKLIKFVNIYFFIFYYLFIDFYIKLFNLNII